MFIIFSRFKSSQWWRKKVSRATFTWKRSSKPTSSRWSKEWATCAWDSGRNRCVFLAISWRHTFVSWHSSVFNAINLVQMVPIKEMTDVMRVVKETAHLKPRQWVRLKRALFRDDLAQIDYVEPAQNIVSLKLIPRIDYSRKRGVMRTSGVSICLSSTACQWQRRNNASSLLQCTVFWFYFRMQTKRRSGLDLHRNSSILTKSSKVNSLTLLHLFSRMRQCCFTIGFFFHSQKNRRWDHEWRRLPNLRRKPLQSPRFPLQELPYEQHCAYTHRDVIQEHISNLTLLLYRLQTVSNQLWRSLKSSRLNQKASTSKV